MSLEPSQLSKALQAVDAALNSEPTRPTIPVQPKEERLSTIPTNITNLLEERGKTHGEYTVHAQITQDLKAIMHKTDNWSRLTPVQKETLEMVAHKIGRVLAGNPNFKDHWDDMAGYSKLTAERLR